MDTGYTFSNAVFADGVTPTISDLPREINQVWKSIFCKLFCGNFASKANSTSTDLALQAYQEIKEDEHPIVVIAAQDIVMLLRRAGVADPTELEKWLSAF